MAEQVFIRNFVRKTPRSVPRNDSSLKRRPYGAVQALGFLMMILVSVIITVLIFWIDAYIGHP